MLDTEAINELVQRTKNKRKKLRPLDRPQANRNFKETNFLGRVGRFIWVFEKLNFGAIGKSEPCSKKWHLQIFASFIPEIANTPFLFLTTVVLSF